MSEIQVAYRPELTKQDLFRLFTDQFGHVYDLYQTKGLGRDFVVQKNRLTTVGVTLRQDPSRTLISIHPFSPSMMLNMLVGGYVATMMMRPGWKKLEKEIQEFVLESSALI